MVTYRPRVILHLDSKACFDAVVVNIRFFSNPMLNELIKKSVTLTQVMFIYQNVQCFVNCGLYVFCTIS